MGILTISLIISEKKKYSFRIKDIWTFWNENFGMKLTPLPFNHYIEVFEYQQTLKDKMENFENFEILWLKP